MKFALLVFHKLNMCKLNLFCKELDGKCNCSGPSALFQEKSAPISGILVSIIDFLRTQPEIMRSLHESSSQSLSGLASSADSFTDRESPITRDSLHDEAEERSIGLLSEPVTKISTGKSFSLLFNIIGTNSGMVKLDSPITVTASIIGKFDKISRLELGQVQTTGAIFFKKLVVHETFEDVVMLVKSEEDTSVLSYTQEITISKRKRKRKEDTGPVVKLPKFEE